MITRRHGLLSASALTFAWPLALRAGSPADGPSLAPRDRAWHALNRLAFGPRPEDAAAVSAEGPERWLERFVAEQLQPGSLPQPAALEQRLRALDTQALTQVELLARYQDVKRMVRQERQKDAPTPVAADARRTLLRPVLQQAATARIARALYSPAQLEEVLVDFWMNHFNVFSGKGAVNVLVGAYEREAIRPHVLGRFRDMLGAVARHPAMLVYLDNAQSVGPGSRLATRKSGLGLNENYARELMELHTLGVDGGYTQQDVTELARILTGWTVDPRGGRHGQPGSAFWFDARRHEPGTKQWLGQAVQPEGQAEGERALDLLAAHPATARHLGFKLAQAFVADQPPPTLVHRLAQRFVATGGDLKAVMSSLLTSDQFWQPEARAAKFKTPYQYLLSSLRATGVELGDEVPSLLGWLAQSGMPLYGAVTPDGYKNTAAAWMNPEGLTQRVQFARGLARRAPPMEALLETLGPTVTPATRQTLAAEPRGMQAALLLASPDFMRR